MTNAGRTRIGGDTAHLSDEHNHDHKFASGRAHRAAHKIQRKADARRATRAALRRKAGKHDTAVVVSEWLTRSPGAYHADQQTGRRYGPRKARMHLRPVTDGTPLTSGDRVRRYQAQNGIDRLTPAQRRRAGLKVVSA